MIHHQGLGASDDSIGDDYSFENENNSEDRINRLVNQLVLNKIRESSSDMDEGVAGKIMRLVPIGLRLPKTPELVNSAEMAVRSSRSSTAAADKEKLKASNFPASFLEIGDWKVVPKNEGHLVAKCYFAKQKLVWEILDTEQKLKRKIEIQWSDISALKATFNDDNPSMLEIEVERPPTFFLEQDPQPRKHTIWNTTTDFTDGQALTHRRHCLIFPKGTLEKPYLKLLQADDRLYQLSQQPFPSSPYPFFLRDPYTGSIVSSNMPLLPSQPLYQQENDLGNWYQARYINNVVFNGLMIRDHNIDIQQQQQQQQSMIDHHAFSNQDYGFGNQMVAMPSPNLYSNLEAQMYQNTRIERVDSLESLMSQNVDGANVATTSNNNATHGSIWRPI